MDNLKYKCPKCGSDNIQSVPIAYKAGTGNVSGNTNQSGLGVAFTSGGIAPVIGFGSGKINATQKTALAETIEPPSKFPMFLEKAVLIISLIGFGTSFYGEGIIAYMLFISLAAVLTGYFILKIRSNIKENMEYVYMEAALIFTWYVSMSAAAAKSFDLLFFLSWLLTVASASYAFYLHTKYNKTQYLKEVERWEKSFICHRCGNIFEL
jgi:hypothetical protein